ncbi:MAG: fluoride efflux transporter CrcB [Candidatus Margulisiibacteriota bacterium]
MVSLWPALLVGMGGAVGSVARWLISVLVYDLWKHSIPWATLMVNLLGCFLIGLSWGLLGHYGVSPLMKVFVLTGILGGFTTFSTFSLEMLFLVRENQWFVAILTILVSNIGGLLLTALGMMLTHKV